jgi:protein phosphatase 1 regulatory subunit 7
MQGCVALEELYLSHNGITKMEGLSSLVNLRVLDVSSNKLTSVDDIPNLTQYVYSSISFLTNELWLLISLPRLIYYRLEDLWLNDNQIESLEGFAEAVAGSRQKLTTIYLENNPCVWILFSLLVEFSSVSTIS